MTRSHQHPGHNGHPEHPHDVAVTVTASLIILGVFVLLALLT
jgi:hypothetical protein